MGVIITKHGEKKELETLIGVCHVTIRRALNDEIKTDLAKRIRKLAIDRGGMEQPDKSKESYTQKNV